MKADSSNYTEKKHITEFINRFLKMIALSPKRITSLIIIAVVSVFLDPSLGSSTRIL